MASTLAAAACAASALFGGGGNDDPAVAPVTIAVVGPNAVSQWNEIATTTINQPAQVARIAGGMHFRFSTVDGAALGKSVADWVVTHHFQAR